MPTPSATTLTPPRPATPAIWTVDALRTVWGHQQKRVNERIETIERAITALGEGRLDTIIADEAHRAAHMLAGSLGMFGFVRAARAAHCIEQQLTDASIDRAPVLAELLESVRSGVRGPVTFPIDYSSFHD